jgi:REP element-mobilizing transposase RayT
MANSNYRTKGHDTVHHLVSRIAHRVYFLKDEERNDFIEMMRRAAEFCGIELIGWCIMTNHFHILAYLPQRKELSEEEVLRRYGVLKGVKAKEEMVQSFAKWRRQDAAGEKRVEEWLLKIQCRMYDVSSYMKILKQWFTIEYNRRYSHKGTLWEAAYFDKVVSFKDRGVQKCLGYIHLNPIRSAATSQYDGYVWSSYAAFCRGDAVATKGMIIAYGEDLSLSEVQWRHEKLLDALLEEEKLRRAEDIARKRLAGYDLPADPLTNEAMIIQAAAHIEEVRSASIALEIEQEIEMRRKEKKLSLEKAVISAIIAHNDIDANMISDIISQPISSTYRILARMKKRGVIEQVCYGGGWRLRGLGYHTA